MREMCICVCEISHFIYTLIIIIINESARLSLSSEARGICVLFAVSLRSTLRLYI